MPISSTARACVMCLMLCRLISVLSVTRTLAATRFLDVAPGITTTVRFDWLAGEKGDRDRWMGYVRHCGASAGDPKLHNLFQIVDLDSGAIQWVNADLVIQIISAC